MRDKRRGRFDDRTIIERGVEVGVDVGVGVEMGVEGWRWEWG